MNWCIYSRPRSLTAPVSTQKTTPSLPSSRTTWTGISQPTSILLTHFGVQVAVLVSHLCCQPQSHSQRNCSPIPQDSGISSNGAGCSMSPCCSYSCLCLIELKSLYTRIN